MHHLFNIFALFVLFSIFAVFLLFFVLYINDINSASNLLNLILFADDTNVFMSRKDLNYLSDMFNLEMDKQSIWFKV